MRNSFATGLLIWVSLAWTGCVTTQVFHVDDECDPGELPLRRTVEVVLEAQRKARMHGFLESADPDSLRLMTSVDGESFRFALACRDVASVTYEFKDREKTRRVAKAAGIAISVALLAVVVATCGDSNESVCRDLFDRR